MLILTAIGTKAQTFTCEVMNQDEPIRLRVTVISTEEKAVEIREFIDKKNFSGTTLNLPSEVTNEENGETYKVTRITARTFCDHTTVTKIAPDADDSTIYDLNGRAVENPTKGIYIITGKKVIF